MALGLGITKQYVIFALPMLGFAIGTFLDRQETLRMTAFRDKSALYGGRKSAEAKPSWP